MKDISVTISKEAYLKLKLAQAELNMLERGGVDNWEWYGKSLNPDNKQSLDEIEKELRKAILGE